MADLNIWYRFKVADQILCVVSTSYFANWHFMGFFCLFCLCVSLCPLGIKHVKKKKSTPFFLSLFQVRIPKLAIYSCKYEPTFFYPIENVKGLYAPQIVKMQQLVCIFQ